MLQPISAPNPNPGPQSATRAALGFGLIAALLLAGCGEGKYALYRKELKNGDQVPLAEWPDQAYIDNLDEMLAAEPIPENAREKADVAMTLSNKPMQLPTGLVPKSGSSSKSAGSVGSDAPGSQTNAATGTTSAEFVPKFLAGLEELARNPETAGSRHVEVQAGEDLEQLLRRVYGPAASGLPISLVNSRLALANPGTDLRALAAGSRLVLPAVR